MKKFIKLILRNVSIRKMKRKVYVTQKVSIINKINLLNFQNHLLRNQTYNKNFSKKKNNKNNSLLLLKINNWQNQ